MTIEDVRSLIPHSGAMCLLSEVVHYTDEKILCHADSHRLPGNPLRCGDRLPAMAGIEYAAQAAAAHCTLVNGAGGSRVPRGLLAGVRAVTLHTTRLDDTDESLSVQARRLVAQGRRYLYGFTVEAGGRRLLDGRIAIVVMDGES
jgi:predicted hotdog family 3-hydroxylacyl-ACP dehydratase